MAYVRQPPPSIEAMLDQFADWMAQHAQAKVTVTIDYRDGSSTTTEVDHRGPKKPKTPNVEFRPTHAASSREVAPGTEG